MHACKIKSNNDESAAYDLDSYFQKSCASKNSVFIAVCVGQLTKG